MAVWQAFRCANKQESMPAARVEHSFITSQSESIEEAISLQQFDYSAAPHDCQAFQYGKAADKDRHASKEGNQWCCRALSFACPQAQEHPLSSQNSSYDEVVSYHSRHVLSVAYP